MKFMISSRHPLTILQQATEIKVDYSDIERLRDFVSEDWTCTADIDIYIPKDQMIEWEKIEIYRDILHITIAVENTEQIIESHEHGFKAYWSFPASSYWELQGLLGIGVDQVLLDAPLYFDLRQVKKLCKNVEIRLQVNKCMNDYMKRKDGVCGTYVRPEDVDEYARFVDHMEFDTTSLTQEKTLWKIYTETKMWPGNLNFLLTYLNKNVDNRGFEVLPTEDDDVKHFAHRRMSCGQRCQQDPSKCSYCWSVIDLINAIDKNSPELLKKIQS